MARGKNINLFLMDGEARGRIKCTLANWTGMAYKIPRNMLEKAKNIKYLQQTGVYFLFGHSDETDEDVVYIGQAGIRKNGQGILGRLEEHKRNEEKDYWTEAVVFTTSNDSFGPTEISYLENRFCNLALETKRYVVKNGNDPSPGNVTEEKESELEEFIDYSKLILGALSYKIFEPYTLIKPVEEVVEENNTVYTLARNGLNAKGQMTAEGFVVLKGSKMFLQERTSCSPSIVKKRKAFLENTDKVSETGILLEDKLFKSPSGAAAFLLGINANGWTEWKDEQGRTLDELERKQ